MDFFPEKSIKCHENQCCRNMVSIFSTIINHFQPIDSQLSLLFLAKVVVVVGVESNDSEQG